MEKYHLKPKLEHLTINLTYLNFNWSLSKPKLSSTLREAEFLCKDMHAAKHISKHISGFDWLRNKHTKAQKRGCL